MTINKRNTLSRVIAVILTIMVVISSFSIIILVSANNNNFDDQPITQTTTPSVNTYYLGVENGYNTYCSSSNYNTYVFRVINPNNGSQYFCFATNTPSFSVYIYSSHYNPSVFQVTGNIEEYNGLYYILWQQPYGYSSFAVPQYQLNEGLNSINEIIGDGDESNTSTSINYSLPPGNMAIITTTANYETLKLTTTMPLQSTVFSSNPWPNTTQRIGTYNTLPQSLNPSVLGNVIEWEKTGDKTLFGNTHSAIYEPNVISKFTYVVISNPYYYPANNMEDNQFTNGAINIVMDDVVSLEVVNLTASVNTSTGEIENNPNGTTWTGEVDDETGDIIWTDNDGESTTPEGGGNLSDPTITGFQSWLKGILTSIRDIFEPAHDAIQTLSGAVRNFANWMYALYVWLPSPILNLLTSAISLAIVIGVIKVFI